MYHLILALQSNLIWSFLWADLLLFYFLNIIFIVLKNYSYFLSTLIVHKQNIVNTM